MLQWGSLCPDPTEITWRDEAPCSVAAVQPLFSLILGPSVSIILVKYVVGFVGRHLRCGCVFPCCHVLTPNTNRMRFNFFHSKCVVIMSFSCHFLPKGEKQSNSVGRSLKFPRPKFKNSLGILVSWAILDVLWDASDWWNSKILVAFSSAKY